VIRLLVRRSDEPSQNGMHAQHFEIIACDFIAPDGLRGVRSLKPNPHDSRRRQSGEHAIAITDINVSGK
jgi:hypothetical protein